MADLIEKLRSSGVKLLQTEAEDLGRWSKLKHRKEDLELFLQFNLAEIKFTAADGKERDIICSSNVPFIKLFSAKKTSDKKAISRMTASGIRTKDRRSVDTWDLVELKRKTMSLASWQIMNFISITPENILVLHELTYKLLRS